MTITAVDELFAKKIGDFLTDHKCFPVQILDIEEKSGWTRYLVIAGVSSSGHLNGVLSHFYRFLDEWGIEPRARKKKLGQENWIFVDCGDFVLHLMDKSTREFYQLETLWQPCKVIYGSC